MHQLELGTEKHKVPIQVERSRAKHRFDESDEESTGGHRFMRICEVDGRKMVQHMRSPEYLEDMQGLQRACWPPS